EMRLAGRHNLANALAALLLGRAAGLPRAAMVETLRHFPGLPHRTQWVAEWGGVRWYNDSKGTNVGATVAALEGLRSDLGRAVLIAGGDGKGADFSPLVPALSQTTRALVLIGRDSLRIAAAAGGVPCHFAGDMEAAVQLAAGLAQPGDHVLLSPACASFDMFTNYEARGRCFEAAVRRLSS
ncbi:MAG: cyanophycin synthetase, partial [Pseudomonadota bacterium]